MKNKLNNFNELSRIVVFLTVSLSLLGLATFFVMPRQEDPRIQQRNAVTTIVLPGAGPEKIERMVVRPLEDELLKVEELKNVEVEIRLNVAVITMELRDDITDFTKSWREVEAAIDRAANKLPPNVSKPLLDFGVIDVEAIVLGITGSDDSVRLIDAAKGVRDSLTKNPLVSEVRLFGAPELEVLVSVNDKLMHQNGISVGQLLQGIRDNNLAGASGLLVVEKERVLLDQDNDFSALTNIEKINYETGRLRNVKLGSFARVSRTTADPPASIFRWNGQPAVGIGIIPKQDINIESFGKSLLTEIQNLEPKISPLKIEMVAFQPDRTKERIQDLLLSLLTGMILIAIFLGATMSGAAALIVGATVPIISLIGLFGYYLTGGVLHQISIAAFVISIGQFIDNIIVVIDSIQFKMRSGQDAKTAASETSIELRSPMAFATATGICAFLPMLSSQGSTADFVFSLPLVAVITLVTSYFVAIFFTPLLTSTLIKKESKPLVSLPFGVLERGFTALALGPFWKIILVVSIIAGISLVGLVRVDREFFPESDRNEFLFAIELEPSADSKATDQIVGTFESKYLKDPRVKSLAAFVGGDIPRFYYNLPNPKAAPQSGQILVTTNPGVSVKAIGFEMEAEFKKLFPSASFTAQFLQQGPPINAKIEVNFYSESQKSRESFLSQVDTVLNKDARVRSVRSDDFSGLRQINMKANEEELADVGVSRNELGNVAAFYSTGVPVSTFRFDRDIIPIRVRAEKGPYRSLDELTNVTAVKGRDRDFTLGDLTKFEATSELPILRRLNGQTFSRVLADLQPNHTFDKVMADLKDQVASLKREPDEFVKFGGDAEGAGEANASILKVVPAAMILLVIFLLIEFRSVRKVLIATLALPVTLMGVFPGLWLGNAPFGFMSLLGILALVGIAINNIILLLEALETQGNLRAAISMRLRAIILTTLLTLIGLIPLALSDSSLWPPLAWTMISGLITGTVATLIVVPALYRVFFRNAATLSAGALAVLFVTVSQVASGQVASAQPASAQATLSIDQILEKVSESNESKLVESANSEASFANSASWREAFAPKLTAGGTVFTRDRDLQTATPLGNITQEKRDRADGMIELRQPVFDASKMLSGRNAAERTSQAAELDKTYRQQALRLKFGSQAIQILIQLRELKFLTDSIENLRVRQQDIKRLIDKGRQSSADLLKLEVARERLVHQRTTLQSVLEAQLLDLKSALGMEGNFVIAAPEPISAKYSSAFASSLKSIVFDPTTGDLAGLRTKSEAIQSRKSQVNAAHFPTIDAYARVVGTEGRTLTDRHWSEAGIELKWEIWGGGVRSSQVGQLEAQRTAIMAEEAVLQRQKSTTFQEVQSKAQERLRWINQVTELAKKAGTSRKTEERRYFEGRGSLNDLIEADSLGLELLRDKEVSSLYLLLDCMQLRLWSGNPVFASCDFSMRK